jgi:hypothetical protein
MQNLYKKLGKRAFFIYLMLLIGERWHIWFTQVINEANEQQRSSDVTE